MAIRVKTGASTWSDVSELRVKTGISTWSDVIKGRIKTAASVWSDFFTATVTPTIASTVTISRNNATYPSTLTGTMSRWTNSTSITYVFQKSSDNVNFTNIGSAAVISNPSVGSSNTVTYALTLADMPAFTSYYRFVVTASNSTYSTSATSTSTSVSVNQPAPINTVAPTISPASGTEGVTTYSVTSNGTWDPVDTDGTYAYQWQSFDQGSVYLNISGATSSTYSPPSNFFTLTLASPIRCRVTATNASGSTAAFSNTATVVSAAPTAGSVTLSPSGSQYQGTQLTATTTGWSGSPSSYNVRIYASASNPPTTSSTLKASSSGASSVTYTISATDASSGFFFKAFATATNASGASAEVGSNVVTSVAFSAPSAPQNLARSTGNGGSKTFTWSAPASDGGAAIMSYQYNLNSSGWFTTSSSTSQSLTLAAGSNVFQVRAVNSVGGGTAASTGTFVVPTINSGPSASSITTTSATVSWTSSNQESYSLSIPGAPSTPYGGSTATSRSITRLSSGTSYTPTLTITSSTGDTATTAGSAFTTSIAPPVNTVAPTISPSSGTAGTTQYSVTNNGTWNPADSDGVYAYLWQSSDNPPTNTIFVSAPGTNNLSSYTPPSNFFTLGYLSPIRCRVTATNGGGSVSAVSNTATVALPAPSGGTVSITTNTGNYTVGSIITYSTTGWDPTPSSYSLRLYNGTNPVLTSDPLRASTTSASGTYTIVAADIPNYFKAFATATNSGGTSTEVSSTQEGPATAAAALNPTFSGNTSTTGGFTGSVTNYDAAYTWNTPSVAAGTLTAGTFTWSAPSGQFRFFTVSGLSSGQSSTITVTTTRTGYNSGSNTTTGTANTLAPVNTAAPTIAPTSGTAGSTTYSVTSDGSWNNSPTSYAYQWQYNDQGAVFLSISGATSSSYSPPSNFNSIYVSPIRCRVTATNAGGSTEAFSNTATVSAPVATVPGLVTSFTATSSLSGSTLSWNATWSAPVSNGGATITSYKVFVERAGSQSGPWIASTTSISTTAGGTYSGAFTAASPYTTVNATTPKTIYGRVTGTAATWIRVSVAAVNSAGTGAYDNSAIG